MTSGAAVVRLTDDHREQAWRLGRLAFGGDPDAEPPPPREGPPTSDDWGVLDRRGRLVAKARLLDLEQWWGGRRVPMGGVAGVAVHPDAWGTGVATALLRTLADAMVERGQAISALFPTTAGLYRRLGWEVVGALEETVLATRELADVRPTAAEGTGVRTAEPDEVDSVHGLYSRWAEESSGLLSRESRGFPDGPEVSFEADVVALASSATGEALGYAAYDRGRGYDASSQLEVWELVAHDPSAATALLAALGRWHPVAPSTRWHGPTDLLALLLPTLVPPPARSRPWMLRVVDPVAAVAARGWAGELDLRLRIADAERGDGTWRLHVRDGRGALEPAAGDASTLHARGWALLYAGAADTGALRRAGLLDGPLPGLDAALAGPSPVLLDYF